MDIQIVLVSDKIVLKYPENFATGSPGCLHLCPTTVTGTGDWAVCMPDD